MKIVFVRALGDVEFYVGLGFEQFSSFAFQDRILVLHESSFICPLLKMKPKSSVLPIPTPAEMSADDANHATTSTGLALGETRIIFVTLSVLVKLQPFTGYAFLIAVVLVAFVAFYLVIRHPERREILRNLIKFRSRSSRVQYSRVSCSQLAN